MAIIRGSFYQAQAGIVRFERCSFVFVDGVSSVNFEQKKWSEESSGYIGECGLSGVLASLWMAFLPSANETVRGGLDTRMCPRRAIRRMSSPLSRVCIHFENSV